MSRTSRSQSTASAATLREVQGFGFDPAKSQHHFVVTIPDKKDERIYISEHFSSADSKERLELSIALGAEDSKLRAILSRGKWDGIAEATQIEFNQRLRDLGYKPAKWRVGSNPVSRLLGKELVLLAWAIEDADPALVPIAIKNWLGFASEERWWLFTMTNAATGHATAGRNKGWRKAVRYALTENPVSEHRVRRSFVGLFQDLDDADLISQGEDDNSETPRPE